MLKPRKPRMNLPLPAPAPEAASPAPVALAALPQGLERMAHLGPPPLFKGENAAAYDDLLARVSAAIRPADIFEEIWLREFLDLAWEALRYRRLKAALVNGRAASGLAQVLQPLMLVRAADAGPAEADQDAARPTPHGLAARWAAHEREAVAEVDALLASADLSIEAALARAFADRLEQVERIDRMIMSAEARRNAVLREIERHRSTLGEELRRVVKDAEDAQDAQDAQDAEFEVVERLPALPAAAGVV
jgi:hypothetical protein